MKTERLYYTDSYLLEFSGRILSSEKKGDQYVTVLDRSAFYPTSGGQLHDLGQLNAIEIVNVVEDDTGQVLHYSEKVIGLVGDEVKGAIDKERREKFRRQHTAQHIASGAFIEFYDIATVSVHLGEKYGAIELDTSSLDPEQLDKIEAKVNELITARLPVEIIFASDEEAAKLPLRKVPSRMGEIRIIRIGEYDYSACGGTHCADSAELGLFKIIGTEKMRSHMLVKFLVADMAMKDYSGRLKVTDQLSKNLTCHWIDLPGIVSRIEDENKGLKRKVEALQKEMLPVIAKAMAENAIDEDGITLVCETIIDTDPKIASQLASAVSDLTGGVVLLLTESKLILTTAAASGFKAGELMKKLCSIHDLRGGGSDLAAQAGGIDRGKIDDYRRSLLDLLGEAKSK